MGRKKEHRERECFLNRGRMSESLWVYLEREREREREGVF